MDVLDRGGDLLVCLSVSLSVCLCAGHDRESMRSCMEEVSLARAGPRNHVSNGKYGSIWRIRLNGLCSAVMRDDAAVTVGRLL